MSSFDPAALKAAAIQVVGYRAYSEHCGAGSVAAALFTAAGDLFTGICVDANSSIGFCAEHAAIAEMLKHRQSRIVAIIAVDGDRKIRPPCGRCRELIRQVDPGNWSTCVIVAEGSVVTLAELLPFSQPAKAAPSEDR